MSIKRAASRVQDGQRYAVPRLEDMVTVSLTGPDGELISWQEVPVAAFLPGAGGDVPDTEHEPPGRPGGSAH